MVPQVGFAQLLSRMRVGWVGYEELREADMATLRTRLCSEHAATDCAQHGKGDADACCSCKPLVAFDDVQRVRVTRADGRMEHVEMPQRVHHCPLTEDSTVLAALRPKVDELNRAWATEQRQVRNDVVCVHAKDRFVGSREQPGAEVSDDTLRKKIDSSARGQPRRLYVYRSMRALLTHNKSVKDDYVNGTLGIIEDYHVSLAGKVTVIFFRPDGWSREREPLVVRPKPTAASLGRGNGKAERLQFPIVPAHAVTVCRSRAVASTHSHAHEHEH